jgi:hypothetical protein
MMIRSPNQDDAMSFTIHTHDSWGVVTIATFATLAEASRVFEQLCQDPWYRQDGTVRGIALVQNLDGGETQRIDWFAF